MQKYTLQGIDEGRRTHKLELRSTTSAPAGERLRLRGVRVLLRQGSPAQNHPMDEAEQHEFHAPPVGGEGTLDKEMLSSDVHVFHRKVNKWK